MSIKEPIINEKLNGSIDETDTKEFYERQKIKMSYQQVAYINNVFVEWLNNIPMKNNYPDMSKFKDFDDYRDTFIKLTYNYFCKKYPDTKYEILKYKKSVELAICTSNNFKDLPNDMYDTVAFKLTKDMPEIYLLISNAPMILDEYSFNAYNGADGPFIKPDWKFN